MPLLTAEEAVIYAPKLGAVWTGTLDALLAAASSAVESYCRRTFAYSGTIVESVSGRGTPRLYLSRPPVASIASIAVNGETIDNANGDAWTIENADWGVVLRGSGRGHSRFAPVWDVGASNVVVTYAGGFAEIPAIVKAATAAHAQYLSSSIQTPGLYMSERLGDYSYTFPMMEQKFPISPAAAAMLSPYIIHGFGR